MKRRLGPWLVGTLALAFALFFAFPALMQWWRVDRHKAEFDTRLRLIDLGVWIDDLDCAPAADENDVLQINGGAEMLRACFAGAPVPPSLNELPSCDTDGDGRLEIADGWSNPIAWADAPGGDERHEGSLYMTRARDESMPQQSALPRNLTAPDRASSASVASYLVSAGPDGRFGSDDDIVASVDQSTPQRR